MIHKSEVEELIVGAVARLNSVIGNISHGDKNIYFVNIDETDEGILVDFETWEDGDYQRAEHDKYIIKVERI